MPEIGKPDSDSVTIVTTLVDGPCAGMVVRTDAGSEIYVAQEVNDALNYYRYVFTDAGKAEATYAGMSTGPEL